MKNINPMVLPGLVGSNTAVATVGSFNLNDDKSLINRMKKTLVPFNNKIIKSNKL